MMAKLEGRKLCWVVMRTRGGRAATLDIAEITIKFRDETPLFDMYRRIKGRSPVSC